MRVYDNQMAVLRYNLIMCRDYFCGLKIMNPEKQCSLLANDFPDQRW